MGGGVGVEELVPNSPGCLQQKMSLKQIRLGLSGLQTPACAHTNTREENLKNKTKTGGEKKKIKSKKKN